MTLIRCLALVLVVYTVISLAAPLESLDVAGPKQRFLGKVGEWFHHLFHHEKAKSGAKRQMDSGQEDEAMFDNLEERLAALLPEERFDNFKHAASNVNARDLTERGEDIPEELNDLSPEARSWWHSLAHHVGNAALTYALEGK